MDYLDMPLHCAMLHRDKQAVLEKAKILIDNGAAAHLQNYKGYTPFELAKLKRNDELHVELEWMLSHSQNLASAQKLQPKIYLETLKSIIENGINQDDKMETVVHSFVQGGPSPEAFHSLCECLAEANLLNSLNIQCGKVGSTAFQEAMLTLQVAPVTLSLLLHSNCFDFNAVDKDGDSILAYAIRGGRGTQFVLNLINVYGADPTLVNRQGESLLHRAVHEGTAELLKALLELGLLNVDERDGEGRTPCYVVAWKSKSHAEDEILQKYKLLVGHGADVNSSANNLHSLLHAAAFTNRKDGINFKLIKLLIADEANVAAKDGANHTFLHACFLLSSLKLTPPEFHTLVEYLISIGHVNMFNEIDKKGKTPLLHVIRSFEPHEATLSLLQSHGVNFNHVDIEGNGLLSFALDGKRSVKFLLALIMRFGVDPILGSKDKLNLIHRISEFGSAGELASFLDVSLEGLDVNGKEGRGLTPLHKVAGGSMADVREKCGILISHGADVNSTSHGLSTPLHSASQHADQLVALKTMRYLMERGSDPFAKTDDNKLFLHTFLAYLPSPILLHKLAEYLVSKNLTRLFLSQGGSCGLTPLHQMVDYVESDDATMKLLHAQKVSFNQVDYDGDSVLARAVVTKRNVQFLSTLVNHFGADHKHVNKREESLLHIAAYSGTADQLSFFLEMRELEINGIDELGETPLHNAVHPENQAGEVVDKCKLLVSHGADINIRNDEGKLPSQIVEESYAGTDRAELLSLIQPTANNSFASEP